MPYRDPQLTRQCRLASLCGIITMVIAAAALGGWLADSPIAKALGDLYVPMAPNSALVLLFLSFALILSCSTYRYRNRAILVLASLPLFLVSMRLLEYLSLFDWGVDRWLFFYREDQVGQIPVGQMSAFTALSTALASFALLLTAAAPRSRTISSVASSLSIVSMVIGLAFCLGYIYGRPLLYGGQIIPMALNTAICLSLLGAGILLGTVAREGAERRYARRFLDAQHHAAHILASIDDPSQAIPKALETVCRELCWVYGGVWRLDSVTGVLRVQENWHEPDPNLELFEAVSRELTFAWGTGLPGQVWASLEAAWLQEFGKHSHYARAAYAREAGLHTAYCAPMIADGTCMGCIELFSRHILEPRSEPMKALNDLAIQFAQYIRRKEAEAVVRENEQRTRLILETANDAFVEIDRDSLITDWNRQAEMIFGWNRKEALGRSFVATIFPGRFRSLQEQNLRRLMNPIEGAILNRRMELAALHRDGRIFPAELTLWPLELAGKVRYNVFIRDITERKKAEEEIATKTAEIQQELRIAREFQEALLPQDYPEVPTTSMPDPLELHFHHVYRPAFTVSGDFFDVIKLSDHQAGIFIADVMGHGARSALITAILRTLLQDLATESDEPGRFLALLNEHYMNIVERSHQFVFVSAFYLIIDTEAATASFASAGHPSPLRADRSTGVVNALLDYGANGPALGFLRDASYETYRLPIKRDDLIILFTDGLVEATNAGLEEFGYERFQEAIRTHARAGLPELSQAIIDTVYRFTGSSSLPDDLCLVTVEVSPHIPATAGLPRPMRQGKTTTPPTPIPLRG